FTDISVIDSGAGFDITGFGSGGSNGPISVGAKVTVPTDFFVSLFDFLGSLFGPVVLDFDGDGINIVPRSDSQLYFDVDGDGFKEQTAWLAARNHDDRFLAIDLNGNHIIDQANEIAFARQTADPNDTDLGAVATLYDTNHNGQLDPGDAQWSNFLVWHLGYSVAQPYDRPRRS